MALDSTKNVIARFRIEPDGSFRPVPILDGSRGGHVSITVVSADPATPNVNCNLSNYPTDIITQCVAALKALAVPAVLNGPYAVQYSSLLNQPANSVVPVSVVQGMGGNF